jgi:hypothetical protein
VLRFDLLNGFGQPLLLLRTQVYDVSFGISVKEVNEPRLGDEQVNDSGPASLAFALRPPAKLAQTDETGDDVAGFGIGRNISLKSSVFLMAEQSFNLFGKDRMFNEREYR